jgi:cation diffusion facilitator CzcD-associated flavoprotein CzcO
MSENSDIAIIGAGPYGLSLAAHLAARGADFRIVGTPMGTWRTQMPKGMFLKSEGFASSLYEPTGTFSLANHCLDNGIGYADIGIPVGLQTFSDYGVAFQQKFVPDLIDDRVEALRTTTREFELALTSGERLRVRRVIVAVGITYFAYLPSVLAELPPELVSHSSDHHAMDRFRGRKIAVIGAGSSAVDIAALLHEAGAYPHLVTRNAKIAFHEPPEDRPRPLMQRLRAPRSGLGLGWRSRLCTDMPIVFHRLPKDMRVRIVRNHLGPAPCWFTKDKVVGKVPMHLGKHLARIDRRGEKVQLQLHDEIGGKLEITADHVIAGTGYKVALHRVPFLTDDVRSRIRTIEDTPVLSTNFESSIPGLFFVGLAAANSFGPLLRFAYGARFTARRLTRHLRH